MIVPTAAGVKVTFKVHFAFAAKVVPQGVTPPGVAEYWPLAAKLMVEDVFWLLVNVTVFGALVVPTGCPANVKLVGEKLKGSTAPPERL